MQQLICIVLLSLHVTGACASQASINIAIERPSRAQLINEATGEQTPNPIHGLAEISSQQVGWADYDFELTSSSWYRLIARGTSEIIQTNFLIDGIEELSIVQSQRATDPYLSGWIWLAAGTHILRVENYHWTGLPRLASLSMEQIDGEKSTGFRVHPFDKTAFEVNRCEHLKIEAGGSAKVLSLYFEFRGPSGLTNQSFEIPPSIAPGEHAIAIPCSAAGDYELRIKSSDRASELGLKYAVFDPHPSKASFEKGAIVTSIQAAEKEPDFASGETFVDRHPGGEYRSSSSIGATKFARSNGSTPKPSWFAYKINGLSPGKPYLLEFDYPDDKPRAFGVVLRDRLTKGYSVSVARETGGIWPLSGQMATGTAIFWPTDQSTRLAIINLHDGMQAAISTIRIFDAKLQADGPTGIIGRDFLIWNEEGDDFKATVSQDPTSPPTFEAVDRYLRLVSSTGANIFSPSAVVYNFAMYPSEFHRAFGDKRRDDLLYLLLGARRYGLKVVPQLHPRADELLWSSQGPVRRDPKLSVSKEGTTNLIGVDGSLRRPPFYDALNRDVKQWYLGGIRELAQRYAQFPEFAGIDLRLSFWQNPGLNNLVSLNWGYNLENIRQFYSDTKRKHLVAPHGPRSRELLVERLQGEDKSAWIEWRCKKIAELYGDIVKAVRAIRPDLKISVSFFALDVKDSDFSAKMLEAGINLDLLRNIDGLDFIDARHQYGAREADLAWRRLNSDWALANETPLVGNGGRANILQPMQYIELPPFVLRSEEIGLPAEIKGPYTSAASNPPGLLSAGRLALALGTTDAFLLGDGGNGYIFERNQFSFISEFRRIPKLPFKRVPSEKASVAVWQRPGIFYAVNMQPFETFVDVTIPDASHVTGTSGETLSVTNGTVTIFLKPFGLRLFTTPDNASAIGAR